MIWWEFLRRLPAISTGLNELNSWVFLFSIWLLLSRMLSFTFDGPLLMKSIESFVSSRGKFLSSLSVFSARSSELGILLSYYASGSFFVVSFIISFVDWLFTISLISSNIGFSGLDSTLRLEFTLSFCTLSFLAPVASPAFASYSSVAAMFIMEFLIDFLGPPAPCTLCLFYFECFSFFAVVWIPFFLWPRFWVPVSLPPVAVAWEVSAPVLFFGVRTTPFSISGLADSPAPSPLFWI